MSQETHVKRYACKKCNKMIEYDCTNFEEEDWQKFQETFVSSKYDIDQLLEKSFVVVEGDHINVQSASHFRADAETKPPTTNEEPTEMPNLQLENIHPLQKQFNWLEKINQIVSGELQVDFPLCSDCTGKINKLLTTELEELGEERRTYENYIQQYQTELEKKNAKLASNEFEQKHQKEIELEMKELQFRLKILKEERQSLTQDLARLDEESRKVEELEQMFFEDANDFRYALENLSDQHAAVRQKIREVKHHLEIMKSTNVFDDAFHIYNDGHFGTINGLRLGRLTSVDVSWEEINAALGQCVLLLDVLIKRVKKFNLKGYELYPLGSFSEIHECKKGIGGLKTYPHQMYGSQKLFGYSGCDKALECFLECINQFYKWIQSQDKRFKMRYQIQGHEIGDPKNGMASVRFNSNTLENWTQALKYMVIDLKYLLAWVAGYTS